MRRSEILGSPGRRIAIVVMSVAALLAGSLGLCLCSTGSQLAAAHACCAPDGSGATLRDAGCSADCCASALGTDEACAAGGVTLSPAPAATGPAARETSASRQIVRRAPVPPPASLSSPILRI